MQILWATLWAWKRTKLHVQDLHVVKGKKQSTVDSQNSQAHEVVPDVQL